MSQLKAFREIAQHLQSPDTYIDEVYDSSRELGEDIGNLATALQAVLNLISAQEHLINEQDGWYSCPQATDEYGEFAILDESRAGNSCDCGVDTLAWAAKSVATAFLGGEP